jgi:hypothetical protein
MQKCQPGNSGLEVSADLLEIENAMSQITVVGNRY